MDGLGPAEAVKAIRGRLDALLPDPSVAWVAPCEAAALPRREAGEADRAPQVVVLVFGPASGWVDGALWVGHCEQWGVAEVYCDEPAVGALTVLLRGRDGLDWVEGETAWESAALGLRFAVEGRALGIGKSEAGCGGGAGRRL